MEITLKLLQDDPEQFINECKKQNIDYYMAGQILKITET